MATTIHSAIGLRHPLEPLSVDEISTVVEILRTERQLGERVRFVRYLEELVAVLRDQIDEDDDQEDRAGRRKPQRRKPPAHQSSPRVRPPSTTTVVPVT